MWDKYSFDNFTVRLARNLNEIKAAQRLRYDVFIEEMGATSDLVDHNARLESDKFDEYFDHLLLFDRNKREINMGVVGVIACYQTISFQYVRSIIHRKSTI